MSRRRISHYNNLRGHPVEDDGTTEALKAEFARRLEARRIAKHWNQSELARRASMFLPKTGKKADTTIGRDSISHYSRGKTLPRPEVLDALAKALDCEPSDLLPPHNVPSTVNAPPARRMTWLPDGKICIMINEVVEAETAMAVLACLDKAHDRPRRG